MNIPIHKHTPDDGRKILQKPYSLLKKNILAWARDCVPEKKKRILKPMLESEYVLWKQGYNQCRNDMLKNLEVKE